MDKVYWYKDTNRRQLVSIEQTVLRHLVPYQRHTEWIGMF